MLIAKGYEVICYSRMRIAAPASYAMLHDPEGTSWPSNSVLIAPFSKDGKEIDDDFAESYFGDPPMGGSIKLPPKSLDSWTPIGALKKIEYTRMRPHGMPTRYEGDYYHIFDGSEGLMSILTVFFKNIEPDLFKRGRMLRLELPNWANLGDEGFIWP